LLPLQEATARALFLLNTAVGFLRSLRLRRCSGQQRC
jgi:hypothetical protein